MVGIRNPQPGSPSMADTPPPRTGAKILVDALRIHGADKVYCVPGESYLAVLDALYDVRDEIPLYICRQEGGAANMADADGKMTGRPGICMVTRGPGATNASIGVHTAMQDSTPMILFIGDIAREQLGREAFQEVDFEAMFAPLAKWAVKINDPARIPEVMARAFTTAVSGRPGPVVIALPEDMLTEEAAVADTGPYIPVHASASVDQMSKLREMLSKAKQPLAIVGGGGWTEAACADLLKFAEANNVPVGASFRCQDRIDNTHPNYAGDVGIGINPKLAQRVRDADLILAIGPRLGEMTTGGYTLIEPPVPAQTLIHVHPGNEELGRVYQAALPINAAMPEICAALAAMEPVDHGAWDAWTEQAHKDVAENLKYETPPGNLDMGQVVGWLRNRLGPDAILTNGAGNFSGWVHRFYAYRTFPTQLAATSGAMGYGVPAAVAAKARHPARDVVGFTGDGDFLMTGQELATAMQYDLAPIILVINNGMYGTIRMHQEREYPARVWGTELENPDFAAYARAFGAHGELVVRTEEFAPAWERAVASGKAAVIECRIDPEAITSRGTLSQIRENAEKAGR